MKIRTKLGLLLLSIFLCAIVSQAQTDLCTATITVIRPNGWPAIIAGVWIDGSFRGYTNSNGKLTINTVSGDHNLEVRWQGLVKQSEISLAPNTNNLVTIDFGRVRRFF